ncbi:hypothetical protein HYH03_005485 [Edaphochlamys debaryana]|uniref:Uncharacterized protein n=1 Tax=Edaphochlamys debaryana TaxID=47281 RepID=A0A835Y5S3_9CHLO|nr:hypothetical protein HYH03_005485 [Edaphochlamys debaryana]|eukprot:KAG2496665.1 hypothetical protein HYH03_005485 [Edaphochlamys debaryana]
MAFDAGFTAAAFGFLFGLILVFLLVELSLLGLGWAAACHLCFLTHELKAGRRAGLFGALSFRAGGLEGRSSGGFDPLGGGCVEESKGLCGDGAHVALTVGPPSFASTPVLGWPAAPAAYKD